MKGLIGQLRAIAALVLLLSFYLAPTSGFAQDRNTEYPKWLERMRAEHVKSVIYTHHRIWGMNDTASSYSKSIFRELGKGRLEEIISRKDPAGKSPLRNIYDSRGHLLASIYGNRDTIEKVVHAGDTLLHLRKLGGQFVELSRELHDSTHDIEWTVMYRQDSNRFITNTNVNDPFRKLLMYSTTSYSGMSMKIPPSTTNYSYDSSGRLILVKSSYERRQIFYYPSGLKEREVIRVNADSSVINYTPDGLQSVKPDYTYGKLEATETTKYLAPGLPLFTSRVAPDGSEWSHTEYKYNSHHDLIEKAEYISGKRTIWETYEYSYAK